MINTIAENKRNFTEVESLYGYTNFKSFEKEFGNKIIYADRMKDNVMYLLLEPIDFGTDMNAFNLYKEIELYNFDGWFIAMIAKW